MTQLINQGGLYGPIAKKGFSNLLTQGQYIPTNPLNKFSSYDTSTFSQTPRNRPYSGPGTNVLAGRDPNSNLQGETNFAKVEDRQAPNLRPVVDVLNYITANKKIGQIERAQLARKNMFYTAPSLSVRPVSDLPAEVLAAQEDALSQVRSTEASSDPVMNLLAKNMATAQRGKMRNEQIAGRATIVLQDRNRFDEQQRQNQQLASETANRNLDREQDFADYRTGVKTAALDARAKLNASTLSQVGQNIDTAAQFNVAAEATDLANARQMYNDTLKLSQSAATPKEAEDLRNLAEKNYAPYRARLVPRLGRAQAMAIDNGILTKIFGQRSMSTR